MRTTVEAVLGPALHLGGGFSSALEWITQALLQQPPSRRVISLEKRNHLVEALAEDKYRSSGGTVQYWKVIKFGWPLTAQNQKQLKGAMLRCFNVPYLRCWPDFAVLFNLIYLFIYYLQGIISSWRSPNALIDMSVLMCHEPEGVVRATQTRPTLRTSPTPRALATYLWESSHTMIWFVFSVCP